MGRGEEGGGGAGEGTVGWVGVGGWGKVAGSTLLQFIVPVSEGGTERERNRDGARLGAV